MSSARTLEKYKYEVGENRTHETYVPLPTATRDSVKLTVGYATNQPNMFSSSLINSHCIRKRDLRSYPLSTYYS